jgi:hypothetical protein
MLLLHRAVKRGAQIGLLGLLVAGASLTTGGSASAQSTTTSLDPRPPGENLTSVDYSGNQVVPVYDDGSFGNNGPFS